MFIYSRRPAMQINRRNSSRLSFASCSNAAIRCAALTPKLIGEAKPPLQALFDASDLASVSQCGPAEIIKCPTAVISQTVCQLSKVWKAACSYWSGKPVTVTLYTVAR